MRRGGLPGAGEAVTAGYEFDVPVRFDTERIAVSLTAFKAGQIPSIPLIEVQLRAPGRRRWPRTSRAR